MATVTLKTIEQSDNVGMFPFVSKVMPRVSLRSSSSNSRIMPPTIKISISY